MALGHAPSGAVRGSRVPGAPPDRAPLP